MGGFMDYNTYFMKGKSFDVSLGGEGNDQGLKIQQKNEI